MVETRDLGHATHVARDAAGRDEVVVALGGDGLVGKLAGALSGSAPLGVVPAGRGNDFARALGIPEDVGGATRVLLDGVRKALDLGEANGKPFACIASMGTTPTRTASQTTPSWCAGTWSTRTRDPGPAGVEAGAFTVRLDGREHRFEGYTVAAANTGYYGGGMNMAPAADASDGLLDVVMVEKVRS